MSAAVSLNPQLQANDPSVSAFVTANTDDQLKKYKELVDAGATIDGRLKKA